MENSSRKAYMYNTRTRVQRNGNIEGISIWEKIGNATILMHAHETKEIHTAENRESEREWGGEGVRERRTIRRFHRKNETNQFSKLRAECEHECGNEHGNCVQKYRRNGSANSSSAHRYGTFEAISCLWCSRDADSIAASLFFCWCVSNEHDISKLICLPLERNTNEGCMCQCFIFFFPFCQLKCNECVVHWS